MEDLSKGMQQKVQFIGAVLHEPDLLVLDEPFSGLDPLNQDVLEEIVLDLHRRGTTVIFSTHLMDQAERLCERVCLIARGRKVLDGELREVRRKERKGAVALAFEGEDGWLASSDVLAVERGRDGLHVILREGSDPQALLRRGLAAGATIRRFELVEPRLHEIFVRHAGADAPAGPRPEGTEKAQGPAPPPAGAGESPGSAPSKAGRT